MNFVTDFIKGIFIGIANIIPGVSGGTMAVSMGIYDKLLYAVNHLFKEFKKSVLLILPLGIGMALGICGFTFIIPTLLSNYPLPTCLCFIGLILGGIPTITASVKNGLAKENKSKISVPHIISFIILFAGAIALASCGVSESTSTTIDASLINVIIMFFIGIIASATMVIPGVSGSMILMILGYYAGITGTVKAFLEGLASMDMPALTHGFIILAPFGVGVIIGVFLIAKLIDFLFQKYCSITYCAILGLIASSPIAILMKMGRNNINVFTIIIAVVLFAAGGIFSYWLGSKEN